MNVVLNIIGQHRGFARIFLWLRSLLAENKIHQALFVKLESYGLELAKKIPDIEAVNGYLEKDINDLNRKRGGKSQGFSAQGRSENEPNVNSKGKYRYVKIVSYEDIIELGEVRDRLFHIDITMEEPGNLLEYLKKNVMGDEKDFYYAVKLSSLKSKSRDYSSSTISIE